MADIYSAAVLADSPVAYWRLGESSGTTAVDEVAGVNGTYKPNSGGAWTGGRVGTRGIIPNNSAGTFNATASVVEIASVPLTATDNLSIELWARWDTIIQSFCYPFYSGVFNTNGYGIRWSGSTWGVRVGGSTIGSVAVNPTDWTHVVAVRRSTAWYLYVNGSESNLSNTTTPTAPGTGTYIGATDGNGSNKWFGQIDEIALYATALSAARVSAHYAAGTLTTFGGYSRGRLI